MAVDPGDPAWFECVPIDVCAVPELNPCPTSSECHTDQVIVLLGYVCPYV
jgi:hypothetical protein